MNQRLIDLILFLCYTIININKARKEMLMNTLWSTFVQGEEVLYQSRTLRFSDLFQEKYTKAFQIDDKKRILEIGCGPGALSDSLARWYPKATVIGTDRDTNFIRFAKEKAPHITFLEDDATALSFADESFDVTISNTVSEHIDPEKFYGEQYRVLKKGGVCLVLSARKGIAHKAPCAAEITDFEKEIWKRTEKICEETDKKCAVCAFPQTEQEMPLTMATHGFTNISTEYLTINLTPDNPNYSPDFTRKILDSFRATALCGIDCLEKTAGALVTKDEIAEMKRLINERHDKRLALYDAGIKQWDTYTSLTMVLRGVK